MPLSQQAPLLPQVRESISAIGRSSATWQRRPDSRSCNSPLTRPIVAHSRWSEKDSIERFDQVELSVFAAVQNGCRRDEASA
jgi:hypothetical protein